MPNDDSHLGILAYIARLMTNFEKFVRFSVYKPRRFRARDKSGLRIKKKIGLAMVYNTISPLVYTKNITEYLTKCT